MSNTIYLSGNGLVKEGKAGGAITPGHAIKRNSSNEFVVQSTANSKGPKLFAVENTSAGKAISDDYASGDNVVARYAQSGDVIYALVPASAAAIVIGDSLVFDGTGCVIKGTDPVALSTSDTYTDAAVNTAVNGAAIVATALEAVDNSAGAAEARLKIEVL
jgi:hypothetical protein